MRPVLTAVLVAAALIAGGCEAGGGKAGTPRADAPFEPPGPIGPERAPDPPVIEEAGR